MSARKNDREALEEIYRLLVDALPGGDLLEEAVQDLIDDATGTAWLTHRLAGIAWAAKSLSAELQKITDLADEATTGSARPVSEEAA